MTIKDPIQEEDLKRALKLSIKDQLELQQKANQVSSDDETSGQ